MPRKVIEVDNLVVRADQRGRKVGRRLLAAVVEWSRQRRAAQVEVMVHDVNRDAQRFYETFGSRRRSIAWCWRPEMRLIGVNRSPYTRRVAITLAALGVPYEQRCVSGFGNRDEVRGHNPLGRIPRWCSTTARR